MERRSWYIPWEDTLTRAQEMHLLLRCYFEFAYYICNCHNFFSVYSLLFGDMHRRADIRKFFFLFEFSTYYLASVGSEWVRYWVKHEKRNSISPSNHVLFCLLYKHLTNKKKSTLIHVSCCSFMALKRVSDVSAADWLSQTYARLS